MIRIIVLMMLGAVLGGREVVAEPLTEPGKREVVWILNDFPPFILVGDALPGEGFIDAALKRIVEHLSDYSHRFEVSSVTRALGLMTQGERVCHPSLLPSEARLEVAVFSEPVHLILPHHIVLPRGALERFRPHLDENGAIDVFDLIADTRLTTAIPDQRVYSSRINEALARHDGPHVQRSAGQFAAAFKQLAAGWIDYVIAYPVEPPWYRAHDPALESLDLIYLPIAGNEAFTLGHVACTRGAWGEQVIAGVDAAVRAEGERPSWIGAERQWLDSEGVRLHDAVFERHNPFVR